MQNCYDIFRVQGNYNIAHGTPLTNKMKKRRKTQRYENHNTIEPKKEKKMKMISTFNTQIIIIIIVIISHSLPFVSCLLLFCILYIVHESKHAHANIILYRPNSHTHYTHSSKNLSAESLPFAIKYTIYRYRTFMRVSRFAVSHEPKIYYEERKKNEIREIF